MHFKVNDPDCKHDKGFNLAWSIDHKTQERTDPAWFCRGCCGFRINFNPEDFLTGIAIVENKEEKVQPPLVSSKY